MQWNFKFEFPIKINITKLPKELKLIHMSHIIQSLTKKAYDKYLKSI